MYHNFLLCIFYLCKEDKYVVFYYNYKCPNYFIPLHIFDRSSVANSDKKTIPYIYRNK